MIPSQASSVAQVGRTSSGALRSPAAPLLLILLGVVLLVAFAWGNRVSYWCPVRVPLVDGTARTAEFVPESGAVYEVELEVNNPPAGAEDLLARLWTTTRAACDLRWEVTVAGAPLLAGDAREGTYVAHRLATWRGRLKNALLFEPFHRDVLNRQTFGLKGDGTVSRGMGYFLARSSAPHQVVVKATDAAAVFAGLAPSCNIRRSRPDWLLHRRKALATGFAGYAAVFGGLAWWGGRRVVDEVRRRRGPRREGGKAA